MGSATNFKPFTTQPIHHLVSRIRRDYQAGKTHILFNCQPEPLNSIWLNYVHRLVKLLPEIPNENFFFITGAMDAQADYAEHVRQHCISRPIKILPLHGWELFTRNNMEFMARDNVELYKNYRYEPHRCDRLFLSFNRSPRAHRNKLLAHFFEQCWVYRSYVSFSGNFKADPWKFNDYNFTPDPHVVEQFQRHGHRLPLTLNISQERENPIALNFDDLEYFRNSYLSVVTETLYDRVPKHGHWEEFGSVFFSEKIFKPIAMKHPFLVVSRPDFLKKLRTLGYLTFHPYINESYDDEPDGKIRMDKIVEELKRLASFTDEQWLDWQKNVQRVVEHNYDQMLRRTKHHDFDDLLAYMGLS